MTSKGLDTRRLLEKSQAPIALGITNLKERLSLAAQKGTIISASGARRIVRFVFGHAGRVASAAAAGHDLEDDCRPLLIVFGRPAVPILIMFLRDGTSRRQTLAWPLDIAGRLKNLSPAALSDARIRPTGKHA